MARIRISGALRLAALAMAALLLPAMAGAGNAAPREQWSGGPGYRTWSIGDEGAPTPGPVSGGFLLSGGGEWNLEAFRWFTARAGHGHLVVLRASQKTEDQEEFYNHIGGLVSVRTFLINSRVAASDARLLAAVRAADAIFIGGGDQSRYVKRWRGTPLNAAIDAHVAAGKPLGGTSAGLAVQGSWLYGCMDSHSITSPEALADPFGPVSTIETDFLHTKLLARVFTDSHFDARARLGRLVAFLAKAATLGAPPGLAGLGVDEAADLTVEPDGTARFHADRAGKYAWLVQPDLSTLQRGVAPLELRNVRVSAIGPDSQFNIATLDLARPAWVRVYDVDHGQLQLRQEWAGPVPSQHATAPGVAPGADPAPADTVFTNGHVYTEDAANSVADSLAVRDGRIAYVGDRAGAEALAGPRTQRIDLGGRMLMPGLIDGHMHLQGGGLRLLECSLDYASLTNAQLQARIQHCLDADAHAAPGAWLVVINWYEQGALPAGNVVTHEVLDGLRTTRPIYVHNTYGHASLVNARGLAIAGIGRDTPQPKDGVIKRDAQGNPNGILEDAAQELVQKFLPTPTREQQLAATREALAAMARQGITSFLDASTDTDTLDAYTQVQKAGGMSARGHFAVLIDSGKDYDAAKAVDEVLRLRAQYDQGPIAAAPSVRVDTAKLFLDGVYSEPEYTGILMQPYFTNHGTTDQPDWRPGTSRGPDFYFSPPQLADTLQRLAAAGINPHMHADGDGAVHEGLDAVEAMRHAHPGMDVRPAIAHDELVDPNDYARYGTLGVQPVLSFQWEKPAPDINMEDSWYLGPVRQALAEPAGLLELYGARVAYGSDWPVDPLDLWFALQVAVTRRATGDFAKEHPGRLGIDPGLTVAQGLRALTLDAAWGLRQEELTGSLEPGKFADLIVIDQNVLEAPPERIGATKVLLTMVGGRIVLRDPTLH
jgi:predicted amidohydrolase YtcJ/cyanophycinase-like exopeptidase